MRVTERKWQYEDYRDFLEISINGEVQFTIGQGEPEDMSLTRDMSDCYNIISMMKQAYEAGKNGEDFLVESLEGYDD